MIFSHVLYQLSYLGTLGRNARGRRSQSYHFGPDSESFVRRAEFQLTAVAARAHDPEARSRPV